MTAANTPSPADVPPEVPGTSSPPPVEHPYTGGPNEPLHMALARHPDQTVGDVIQMSLQQPAGQQQQPHPYDFAAAPMHTVDPERAALVESTINAMRMGRTTGMSAMGRIGRMFTERFDFSAGPTPDLIRYMSNLLVGPRRPDAYGEMLMTQYPLDIETRRLRYFDKRGKSQVTSGGVSDGSTRSVRGVFRDMRAEHEILTGDGWGLNELENQTDQDLSFLLSQGNVQHREDISQWLINELAAGADSYAANGAGTRKDHSGNTVSKGILYDVSATSSLTADSDAGSVSFDNLLEVQADLEQNHYVFPDCILMSKITMARLMKSDDFKNSDYFQYMADYTGAPSIPTLFGMRIYATSQITTNDVAWLWQKSRYMVANVRRYSMFTNFVNNETHREGFDYSTKIGTTIIDGEACARLQA